MENHPVHDLQNEAQKTSTFPSIFSLSFLQSPLKSRLQLFLRKLTKRQSYRNFFIFLNFLTLLIFSLIYDRQPELQERLIRPNLLINPINPIILDIISLVLNVIFLLESIIEIIINSKALYKLTPLCNLLLLLCSIILLSLSHSTAHFDRNTEFLKNILASLQTLRFFFLTKYVRFMKRFLRIFRQVLAKSFPIIFFFLIVWFSYGLIGTTPIPQ